MAFANTSYSDILATTIESRSKEIQDNVTNNSALLFKIKKKGNAKPVAGGHKIIEPISFAENSNGAFYSGYDTLSVAASDVISAAEYAWKQYACPVVISGLEMAQNSGKEGLIDLMAARLKVAEATMMNDLAASLYSDGTASGGKELTGLGAAVPITPTTGTYGGIDRATYTFWRSRVTDTNAAPSSTTIQGLMNLEWANLVRNADHPDLIVMDNTTWAEYVESLQAIQRFTDPELSNLGFTTLKFMGADVVLDGGISGQATSATTYFLNTNYLHWRPHTDRNMVPLNPGKRYAVNQDAEVQILGFMGNLTASGSKFHSRLIQS